MVCKYCGKDIEIVLDSILTGEVCDDCYSVAKRKVNSCKDETSVFYKRLRELDLWDSFVFFLDMFKRDNKLLHFNGVKKDKRRKCPYVLVYRGLSCFDIPQIVEISISEQGNIIRLQVNYKWENNSTELLIDKDGKYYEGNSISVCTKMNWVKKEFGL